jgi:hypothetical protein
LNQGGKFGEQLSDAIMIVQKRNCKKTDSHDLSDEELNQGFTRFKEIADKKSM